MTTNLIEIGTAGIALSDALYESLGEITPEIETAMDELLAKGEESLDGAAYVVRKIAADVETCKAEAKRYKERAESLEKAAESLKARMLFAVDSAFNGKIKTAKNTIWGQNSAGSVSVELAADADLAKLNETDSVFVKKAYSLDTAEIRRYHSAGEPIPNAIIVTDVPPKRFLRIK